MMPPLESARGNGLDLERDRALRERVAAHEDAEQAMPQACWLTLATTKLLICRSLWCAATVALVIAVSLGTAWLLNALGDLAGAAGARGVACVTAGLGLLDLLGLILLLANAALVRD